MPDTKHNMFAVKLIGLAVSVASVIIGVLTINWSGVIKFGHSVNFLYDNVEEMEHILDDFHQVLSLEQQIAESNRQIDSLKKVLFETRSRDSLISVISHLNRGKFPYDSIWVKGPSGTWYMTTMEKHFTEDHED